MSKRLSFLSFLLLPLVFLGLSLSAFGQAISATGGSIQGTITDPSGAAVAGATVTISSPDTGYTHTEMTSKAGFYSIGPLNPGKYVISITAPTFQKLDVTTVVQTGVATSGSEKLTLGEATETIQVSASALQVNTDQIGVSGVINQEQINTLPVNGRNILDYAQLQPGVILQSGESFDPTKAGYSAISVSGVGGRTTRILLDGQDITDETVGTTIFNVPSGAVEEVQVNRSTQDVSGSVTSTGQVLVSTTSGTNTIHGNAFYNFQDARAGAANVGGQYAPFQRNQFGGYVGGPLLKDKLFFFVGGERLKQQEEDVAIGNPLFQNIYNQYPFIPAPFRDTFSMGRLDYNGPHSIHAFVRAAYSVNSDFATFGYTPYQIYQNRDNVPAFVAGVDIVSGKFTHSFHGGYEKFHNLLQDGTAALGSSIYNPSTGPTNQVNINGGGFYAGPNFLAPQGTYQTDKQFRYDGTWTKGAHTVKFGFDMNRINSGGFAEFYGTALFAGFSPIAGNRVANCNGTGTTCPNDPVNGYIAPFYEIGNGNGFFSERPGFGLAGGLAPSWRFAAYVADTWKASSSLTLTGGIRWSVDTDRANQDLATPLCSSVDPAYQFSGCTGNTPLFDQYQAGLGVRTHQPYKDFGPQVGFVFSPGSHKTSYRGGLGFFYESSVFNNSSNARTESVQTSFPAFNNGTAVAGQNSINLPGYGVVTQAPDGTPVSTILNESIAQAAPELNAIKAEYQAKVQGVATSNPSYIGTGNGLYANSIYAGPYNVPYSIQYNGGFQREITPGLLISADYVHNSTLRIPLTQDVNHNGAARTLNTAAAQNAILNTMAAYPTCPQSSSQAAILCAIQNGATIANFAQNGLDSGAVYNGNLSASANGRTIATGAAFPGTNPNLGSGRFILPIGRSGYDALQVVLQQQKQHPMPGIVSSNLQISYTLSRIVTSTSSLNNANATDQFFQGAGPWNNDNPNEYIGRSPLDHTNELSFGGSITVKYGAEIGLISHFYSATPDSLALDNTAGATGQIFLTDVTGDGTTGDLLPGTNPGYYEHQVKGAGLNNLINAYNSKYAGQLTPAGQALVSAGLFTQSELSALGAVQQPIAAASNRPLSNAALRTFDINVGYPIHFTKLRQGLTLTPTVAMFNAFNMSNFGPFGGTLLNVADAGAPGYLNGPTDQGTLNANRTTRNSGTFDQGGPRTTEFQLKLQF
ncbi:MAG: TonB-dependent receptor [Acidobacteria bacterium]|nr:TonB-dependent receptor [Acidobacteriota bacterium]